jgi:hypothetical protein
MKENEFPYMSGRLKNIDWEAILEKGKPWEDPEFRYGKYCLYQNRQAPKKETLAK